MDIPRLFEDPELPFYGHEICREASTLARKLREGVDEDKLYTIALDCLLTTAERYNGQSVDELLDNPYDLLDIFSYPADFRKLDDLMAALGVFEEAEDPFSKHNPARKDDKSTEVLFSMLLNLMIYMLKQYERISLDGWLHLRYKKFTQRLDYLLYLLTKLLFIVKVRYPARELLKARSGRKSAARKGGQAKNESVRDLKKSVVEEAQGRYADRPATQAARLIVESFEQKNMLNDVKLVDPVERFTIWIRQSRKQKSD